MLSFVDLEWRGPPLRFEQLRRKTHEPARAPNSLNPVHCCALARLRILYSAGRQHRERNRRTAQRAGRRGHRHIDTGTRPLRARRCGSTARPGGVPDVIGASRSWARTSPASQRSSELCTPHQSARPARARCSTWASRGDQTHSPSDGVCAAFAHANVSTLAENERSTARRIAGRPYSGSGRRSPRLDKSAQRTRRHGSERRPHPVHDQRRHRTVDHRVFSTTYRAKSLPLALRVER
ncbi:MAG: hypothetical protein RL385_3539 [Pseudomonadota bacterium]|jgi:hypothetical protein